MRRSAAGRAEARLRHHRADLRQHRHRSCVGCGRAAAIGSSSSCRKPCRVERRQLMKAYGAELVLTEGAKGMKGAIAKAEELAKEIPDSFVPGQFVEPGQSQGAFCTLPARRSGRIPTARWIYFVAGVGTGGTITGVGEYLKSQEPDGEGRRGGARRLPRPFQGHAGPAQDSGHRRGLCAGCAGHESL